MKFWRFVMALATVLALASITTFAQSEEEMEACSESAASVGAIAAAAAAFLVPSAAFVIRRRNKK